MHEVKLGTPEWTFTPEFDKNKAQDTPGTVKLRLLTVEEQEECVPFGGGKIDRVQVFKFGVVEFNGWGLDGKEIKTADDVLLAQGRLYGLFIETWAEITNKLYLTEDEEKN